MSSRLLSRLLLIVVFGACADPTEPASKPDAKESFRPGNAHYERYLLARSVAAALGDEQVRRDVRNAMRRSRVTEHKLALKEFLSAAGGRALVTAGAGAIGMTANEYRSWVATMPELDFYLPAREDRMRWRGGPDVVVGAPLGDDDEITTFSPSGQQAQLSTRRYQPSRVVLFIQDAEPKGLRIDPQPDTPGEVIQDLSDGEISGAVVEYPEGQRPIVRDLSSIVAQDPELRPMIVACEDLPEGCSGDQPPVPPAPQDTTIVAWFETVHRDDNGNPYEGNEFELRTHFYRNSTRIERRDLKLYGVAYDGLRRDYVLMFRRPRETGEMIAIDIVEVDSSWNPDDDLGEVRLYPSRPGQSDGYYKWFWWEGIRCDVATVWGPHHCADTHIWSEINVRFSRSN